MKKTSPDKKAKKTSSKSASASLAKKTKTTTTKPPELIIGNTQIKLVIPLQEAQKAYTKTLAKLAPQVKAEGFRKGKVPPHIAENLIGKINIIERTLQELIPAIYTAEIKKLKKEPLTDPDIRPLKITMEADWELTAEIAEKPNFKLGDYKKIAQKALKEAAQEIKIEEKKIHDHSSELKKDDQPAKDHAGKHTHPLTAKQKDDLKLSHIFKNLVQEIKPQIPELLLREKVKSELRRLESDLKSINTTLEEYLEKQKTTFENFSQQLAVMHLGQIQLEFILREITDQEKLIATPAEIKTKLDIIAAQLKLDQTPEAIEARNNFDKAKYTPYITSVINREKVTNFLLKV